MPENKNIPALRFPGFTEPWEKKTLEEIATNKSGKYNPEKEYNFTKCVELEHLETESGRLLGYIDGSSSGSIKNKFQKGDVLFGKLRPYLKKYLQASFDGVCSSEIWVLSGRGVTNDFLFRIIQTDGFVDLANQSSGSKMPRADWNVVKNGCFSFPTISEQNKIANFLSAIDERVHQLQRQNELLEKYKKGCMQQIFNQKLRFKDKNENNYPGWEEKNLADILVEHKIRNIGGDFPEVFSVAKNKGVINQIEHLGRSYSSLDITNYKVVFANDIVYTKSPTSDFPFGIIKQNKLERPGVVSVLYAVFTPVNKYIGAILDYYFSSFINTYNYLNPLVQRGAKNTMNIANDDFLNGSKIMLPISEDEQIKIVNFLSSLDEKIQEVKQQLLLTQKFKKGLLNQMFI
jgi:type I restriction enzyme, S subunit